MPTIFSADKVQCIILKDTKVIKEEQLRFSSKCESAEVKWKCRETGMFRWAVHSNRIGIAKGIICVEKKEDKVAKLKSK
jgi:hypothetical protein